MGLKEKIISITNRETLLYKIIDQSIFYAIKYRTWIFHGHINRSKAITQYINNNSIKKLHLGCGGNQLKGFLNSDIFGVVPIDITKKLPFQDNTFNLIYSNHLCEHIYNKEFQFFLKETHRVLGNGGMQIICMPSIEKIAKIMYCNDNSDDANFMKQEHLRLYSLEKGVFGSNYINDVMHICFGHKYLYDYDFLQFLGKKFGYSKVEKINNFDISDPEIQENLNGKGRFWDITSETFIFYK